MSRLMSCVPTSLSMGTLHLGVLSLCWMYSIYPSKALPTLPHLAVCLGMLTCMVYINLHFAPLFTQLKIPARNQRKVYLFLQIPLLWSLEGWWRPLTEYHTWGISTLYPCITRVSCTSVLYIYTQSLSQLLEFRDMKRIKFTDSFS